MNKKQLIEFVPIALLLISGMCEFFNMPFSRWTIAVSGLFIAALYFYLAFWLYAEFSISLINRIIAGLVYSANIVAWMFCFLNWYGWQFYCIFSYLVLGLIMIISFF